MKNKHKENITSVTRPAEPDGGLHYTHTMTHFHEEAIKSIGDNFCVEVHKMDEEEDYEGEYCRRNYTLNSSINPGAIFFRI